MDIDIHRASRAYYAHSTTLLNVPDQRLDSLLRTSGWEATAAAKFLDLPEVRDVPLAPDPSRAERVAAGGDLTSQDLDELLDLQGQLAPADVMAELVRRREQRRREAEPSESIPLAVVLETQSGVPYEVWQAASHELLDALLPSEGRDPSRISSEGSEGRNRALATTGVANLTLVPDFPILTATYGFTRTDFAPNAARLNAFPPMRAHGGRTPIYVDEVGADAIVISLNHQRVLSWLDANGTAAALPTGTNTQVSQRAYFVRLLTGVSLRETISVSDAAARMVFGLVHTFSHLAIRHAALLCGLDRTSLSEYMLPRALSSAIYCNHRFGATIGALTALFEGSVADWFGLIETNTRCVYDPVCADRGGNCHACVHLPETSCRFFNLNLSRAFCFGGQDSVLGDLTVGYFDRRLD